MSASFKCLLFFHNFMGFLLQNSETLSHKEQLTNTVSFSHSKMNLYLKHWESAPSVLYGLLCFFAFVVWTLVAILTLPLWCLFRIFKWFQGICISYYRLGRVLASWDVPFLHETEYNRNFINGLFVVDGPIDLLKLRDLIMARVVQNDEEPSYARMRKVIVKSCWRYVWQDEPDFNINKHVYLFEGPSPCNEPELQRMLSEQFSSPVRDNISPWEILLVPLDMLGKDRTAICMRIHHALGDGFALIGVLSRLMDKKPELLRVKKPVVTPCDKQKQVRIVGHSFARGEYITRTILSSSVLKY